ncbi:hypothetical protein M440DRAFT_1387988 [Trichoderma longibrachiatum ATCC 18648]|uniref:J domain-containing protein n=1 Tax=Trichoderma longibrachiatum ATCC 18648 TaxID=983965 RepID=A0A2T4CJ90_TRILO|nr:hypothetical protein M440DRAFT_1387988 [Trichoderma longibrachiatum ATCC 18648]
MKIEYLVVGVLSLLTPLAAAWSKEDREIFRIRDEIAAHESDPAASFYDILGVTPSASQDDINKAYRKKSRSLHPDKVKQQLRAEKAQADKKKKGAATGGSAASSKGPTQAEIRKAVKEASERQARLSLIANILRGPARDRYDHFLANGFPLWKGTDYYYNRYRPGLGTVLVGVFMMGGGAIHYLALYMSWKRQREFVERYVRFARNAAWGNDAGIPGVDAVPAPAPAPAPEEEEAAAPAQPRNRRERRMQEKETRKDDGKSSKKARKAVSSKSSSSAPTPTGVRKRVVAENGKILVVDSQGDVFLEEEDEEGNVNEFLLDPNELVQPTFKDTAVVRVPVWVFRSTVGRFLPKGAAQTEAEEIAEEDSDAAQNTPPSSESAGDDFEILDKSTDSLSKVKTTGAQQGKATKRKATKKR